MKMTCVQMDVLISFYIDGDLSDALKKKVEEHIENCPTCRAKYNILSSLLEDMKTLCRNSNEQVISSTKNQDKRFRQFHTNLSAYIDNELPSEENLKMKKFTINNKYARKELEDVYNIRKLMSNSFKKTKSDLKSDFSKNVMQHIDSDCKKQLQFNPIILVSASFIITVIVISAIIVYIFSL